MSLNKRIISDGFGNIKLTTTNKIVLEEALNRGIRVESMNRPRYFRLVYGRQSFDIRNGRIARSFNTNLARKCTRLKEVTSRLLKDKGFPAPENIVVSSRDMNRAWNWASPILPIVLKPNKGVQGIHVYVNIKNFEEFALCFNKIAGAYSEVLIEQFVEGTEYRFTLINEKVVAITKRRPASVLGNGVANVKQLLKAKNKIRAAMKPSIHKMLKIDEEAIRVMKNDGFDADSIPQKGERIFLRKNSNISTGGDAISATDTMDKNIVDLVENTISAIPGLNVCGMDVIIDKNSDLRSKPKISIIEINDSPMLSMHHYPWEGTPTNVAKILIDAMFPATANRKRNIADRLKRYFSAADKI